MNYSYERVSTLHQDERRQELSLESYRIDRRYIDKRSGKNTDRPELMRLLSDAKAGDHIYVESISRLGRNVDDLRRITEQFHSTGVTVHFVKEGFDTSGQMYKFMLTILGAVAETERETSNDRVIEGLEKAKRYGTKSGRPIGRPPVELPKDFEKYYWQWRQGNILKIEFARLIGKSRNTLYRYVKLYEAEGREKAG